VTNPVLIPSARLWTTGRFATDLAIVMIAVPLGLKAIAPETWFPGSCGDTPENNSLMFGSLVLAASNIGTALKALNDAGKRAINPDTRRGLPGRKPTPLDDF
jgi:hypothetical protein